MTYNIWSFKLVTGTVILAHVAKWGDHVIEVVNPMRLVSPDFGIGPDVKSMEEWQIFNESEIVYLERTGFVYTAPATGHALQQYVMMASSKIDDYIRKYQ